MSLQEASPNPISPSTFEKESQSIPQVFAPDKMHYSTENKSNCNKHSMKTMQGIEQDNSIEQESQQVALKGESMAVAILGATSTSTVETITSTRISYNNGFGDFCFGRLCDRPQGYDNEFWRQGSNAIPVVELDSFERPGSFPFFELPQEIRDKIYGLLLDSIYTYNQETKVKYVNMSLKDNFKGFNPYSSYNGDFDKHLEWFKIFNRLVPFGRFDTDGQGQVEEDMCQEEYEAKKAEFYKRKEATIHRQKSHPHRRSLYNITITAYRTNDKVWQHNDDILLIDWIRQASNVSNIFRAELGKLIWSHVMITTTNGSDMWHLPQFLKERPSTCQSLRKLWLDLDMEFSNSSTWDSEGFREWCTNVSRAVEVEDLFFFIRIGGKNLHHLSQSRGRYSGLAASKILRVKTRFEVYLSILTYELEIPGSEHEEEYNRRLEEKYEPMIEEIMLPDTLRKVQTEEEEYLSSRPSSEPPTQNNELASE